MKDGWNSIFYCFVVDTGALSRSLHSGFSSGHLVLRFLQFLSRARQCYGRFV